MRPALDVLPRSLAVPRLSPRAWLALAAALGCGACAYAGLYPRFDGGRMRVVLALTSLPFGAAVVAASLEARSAAQAFFRTAVLAAVLGVASTVVPILLLTSGHSSDLGAVCVFGAIFGALTGAFYGLPLGALAALGHRHLHAHTHDATDRGARVAGAWLFVLGLVALAGTRTFDPTSVWDGDRWSQVVSPWPSVVACASCLGGLLLVARASLRLRRRQAWVTRVRAGLEPSFRVRPADARDNVELLPHLGDGASVAGSVPRVIEWRPDEASPGAAYRVAATGRAVALVSDGYFATREIVPPISSLQ